MLHPVSNQTNRPATDRVGLAALVSIEPRTLVHDVHSQLRQAILRGQLPPGQWLIQEELASSFGVSRMPIRDALRTLSAEGLVEILPHRGARVAPLSAEELEELYAARMGLEGLAARLAATQMRTAVLDQMARALHHLQGLSGSSDLEAFLTAEAEYHQVCYAVTGRERLCRTVADLRERAGRYLRVVFDAPSRFDESLQHQYSLFEACERRDGARAERVLQDALRWTLRYADDLLTGSAQAAPTGTATTERQSV